MKTEQPDFLICSSPVLKYIVLIEDRNGNAYSLTRHQGWHSMLNAERSKESFNLISEIGTKQGDASIYIA